MAVELRNALGMAMGRSLPSTLLFDYPTLEVLTGYFAAEVLKLPVDAEAPAAPGGQVDFAAESARLEELFEDDLAALLREELAAIKQKRATT